MVKNYRKVQQDTHDDYDDTNMMTCILKIFHGLLVSEPRIVDYPGLCFGFRL